MAVAAMPYLSPQDRANLLGPTGTICHKCKCDVMKNYCRQCDEFFYECQCPRKEHNGHRTY